MQPDDFCNLLAYSIARIQAGRRLLENHCDFISANRTHLFFAEAQQICAIEKNLSGRDCAGMGRKKAHVEEQKLSEFKQKR